MTGPTQAHYGREDIVARVLAAVGGAGPLSAEQLYPLDQLHGRELLATRDHVTRLGPGSGDHVLDIGSGIGGPARYIAQETGARVTGLDLTPQFVDAATELSARAGLSDRVAFHRGDATAMPFAAHGFDGAICFYVGMNLPDKPAVLAEAFRVLKPGGRLIWTEAVLSGDGGPAYPLPWASEPEHSHLVTRDDLCAMVEQAGFAIMDTQDETQAHLELARARMKEGSVPTPEVTQSNAVVMGPDFAVRRKSYIAALGAGQLASLMIEAQRPT